MPRAFHAARRVGAMVSRVTWSVCWRSVFTAWVVLASCILLLRYVAAPQVAAHRADIEQMLSQKLGLQVRIGELQADWSGLHPALRMRDVHIADPAGRDALRLPAVDAALAWSSLLDLRLEFSFLHIERPDLFIRREADGRIFVAGLPLQTGGSNGSFGDFLVAQDEISIKDAAVHWDDRQRKAPQLDFDRLSILLRNDGDEHRFAILATPGGGLSGPLDVRGDLRGDSWSELAKWRGTLYLDLTRSDLTVWRRWIDYPVSIPEGHGALRAWLNFEGTGVAALTADLELSDVRARLAPELPMLELNTLSGRFKASTHDNEYALSAEHLVLATRAGLRVGPTQFSLRRTMPDAKRAGGGEIAAERLDMGVLAQLAAYLPLPDAARERLKVAQPQGLVTHVRASWSGEAKGLWGLPEQYSVDSAFEHLVIKAGADAPGVEDLSGSLSGNERAGQILLNIRNGSLDLEGVLHEPHVAVTTADLDAGWVRNADNAMSINIKRLRIDNPDLTMGEFTGAWRSSPQGGAGEIDLSGNVLRADPTAVWHYMPVSVPQDTGEWLKRGLTSGSLSRLRLKLAGDLSKFPFERDPGTFQINSQFAGVNMDFASGWPVLGNLTGDLEFNRARMSIHAQSAVYRRVRLSDVNADIADLGNVHENPLKIVGHAAGPASDMLDYVRAAPVAKHLGSFIQNVRVDGDVQLLLKLDIPLDHADDTLVDGTVRFDNNTAQVASGVPLMHQLRGNLGFNGNGIGPTQLAAQFMGGPVTATGKTLADGSMQFDAAGTIPASGLKEVVDVPVWAGLSGQTQASARITVSKAKTEVAVRSDLQGLSSALPAPFAKSADARLPFSFGWMLSDDAGIPASATQDWQLALGQIASAHWQDHCNTATDRCDFSRGVVALGDTPAMPTRGMRVAGRFHTLDLDQWRPFLPAGDDAHPASGSALAGVALAADEVLIGGYRFADVSARAVDEGAHWALRLNGPDIVGDLTWSGGGQGRLLARLSLLRANTAPGSAASAESAPAVATAPEPDQHLPALDIQSENFELRGMQLGKLALRAENVGNEWRLNDLRIENNDGVMVSQGVSRTLASGGKQTDVDLDIQASNAGGFLGHFGFHDALQKGKASLKGHLSWNALPTNIDYPTLTGELRLEAEDGRFNKLEAGAGRLLGILSLQSISRRLTFDFKDIFSDGFAFDSITGDLKINNGVLNTNNLQLKSPGATVFMRGTTDLGREHHDLRITVQPRLSDPLAIGVAAVAVNPLIGVATYVAQKVLSDPVEKIFSFDYSVTGDWNDPKIEKISGAQLHDPSAPVASESAPRSSR